MKKKSTNSVNGVVTKGVLKKELKSFESRLERRMDKKFATKNELKDEIDRLENRVKLMVDQLERNIDEKNKKYRDEFLTDIDPILKEVLASREERTIIAHQVSELRDRVDEHEVKIKQLKQLQS